MPSPFGVFFVLFFWFERKRGGGGRGRGRGRGTGGGHDDFGEPIAAQSSTAGMMPPSSEEDEEESGDEENTQGNGVEAQNPNAGMMPPSSDSDEDEDEDGKDDEESDDDGEDGPVLVQPASRARADTVQEPSPAQIARDMERLALVRRKREEDRQRRIREEGWDRFAPISDTNRPPS